MFKFTVELFPNLFRSFSNQHHFPEKKQPECPLNCSLYHTSEFARISHGITVSVLYAGTDTCNTRYVYMYVVVQFYPWFNFYFPLFQTHYHILPCPKTKGNKN